MTTPQASVSAPAQPQISLWRNRPYLLLMSGKTTQIIGEGVGTFAVPLVAFGLTHSVVLAGVVAAVGEAGSLLATLPAGVLADRADRRGLLIAAAVVGTALWSFAALAGLAGALTAWQLAIVLFGASVATAVFNPAEVGAIRAVVATDQLAPAMAAVQGRSAAAALIASPIGGVLYAVSRALPFAATAIGHLAVVVCTGLVRVPLNGDRVQAKAAHPVEQLKEGIRFVARLPLLRNSLWLIMLINLTVNGTLIAVNLQLVRTHTAPLLIGLLDTVAGAVMLLGSVIAGPLLKRVPSGLLAIVGLGVTAAAFLGMSVVHDYVGYLVFLAFAFVLIPAVNSGIGGYVTAIVPDELQGRVNSVSSLGYLAVAPLAPVVAGALLAQLGIVPTLWIFSAALAAGVVGTAFVKEIRRIGSPDTWAADARP
ncbi:MFS transporter [Gryllotalpicola protaetiae]|uniref:MFS transporter n=1 Tax=Gryllotalpicola protaetiae TaxID=2419771 RepID=A0A387BQT0_9MICO|nr:MFS transporter [Gryllotalpicola protaetiae]AYG03336.1 MFS transporter [Gryllotalpicola protaetiae]